MSAGLPGAGIAGVFYLASALLMPAIEVGRTIRGRSSLAAWRVVIRQFSVSCAILAGIWTTGWLLGLAAFRPVVSDEAAGAAATTPQVVGQSAMLLSVLTLVVLVGGVEVLSFFHTRVAARTSPREA
jgi:hypothetical protein